MTLREILKNPPMRKLDKPVGREVELQCEEIDYREWEKQVLDFVFAWKGGPGGSPKYTYD